MSIPVYIDYAEYYDYDHNTQVDVDFYLEYAKQCGSPILELACGTGRLIIPLAKAGFNIYGVDLSENMLKECYRKAQEQNLMERVHLTLGNMADFDLSCKEFTMAYIPVRSFMHLFTQEDQLSCLQKIYEHLVPGGLVIIDVYAPNYQAFAQEPDGDFIFRREFNLPNGHHVIRKDRFVKNDPVQQIQYNEIRFEEYGIDGALIKEQTFPLNTRYTFRYEMQLLLEKVGFEIIDIFRDYDKNPYDGTGEIIVIARRS